MKIFFDTFSRILGLLFAFLCFSVFIIIIFSFIKNENQSNYAFFQGNSESNQKIAILNINGPIISDHINLNSFDIFNKLDVITPSIIKEHLSELETIKIKGLIISLNSPGGSVSASQEIYSSIIKFKKNNRIPIYFHSSDILASGGYWISLSGDKIFANYGAIIGSIGVKGPDWLYYNSPTLLSRGLLGQSVESPEGIKLFTNIAGKSKDIFNPFRQPNKKEVLQLQQMVDDIYNDFINIVSASRKIDKKIIQEEIGAMIFNTSMAKNNYLIDGEKDLNEVIKDITKKLDLKSHQIISNSVRKKNRILSLNNLYYFLNDSNIEEKNNIIKNSFCNNLFNEFSVVAINNIVKC